MDIFNYINKFMYNDITEEFNDGDDNYTYSIIIIVFVFICIILFFIGFIVYLFHSNSMKDVDMISTEYDPLDNKYISNISSKIQQPINSEYGTVGNLYGRFPPPIKSEYAHISGIYGRFPPLNQ